MIIFEQGRRRVYNWGHNRTGGRGWEEMAKSEELSKYEKWGKKWSESLICWTKKWKKGADLFFFILDQLFASLCSDAVHPSSSDIQLFMSSSRFPSPSLQCMCPYRDPTQKVVFCICHSPYYPPLQVFPHQWKPPSPKVPSCLARSLLLRTSVDKGGEEGDSGVKYKKTQQPCIPSTHLTKSSTFSSFLRSASCSKMCMFCNNQCVYS